MNKIIFVFASALLVTWLAACTSNGNLQGHEDRSNPTSFNKQWAKSFIDSVNTKFSVQIAAGDSAALASHYWPDAELLLDNSEVVKGKDILNAWGATILMGVKEMIFSTCSGHFIYFLFFAIQPQGLFSGCLAFVLPPFG